MKGSIAARLDSDLSIYNAYSQSAAKDSKANEIAGSLVHGVVWNEFLFAVTLSKTASQPITVVLAQLAGGEAVKWNLPTAGALLAALPTLLVYIIFGRFFIRELLSGSVKG